MKTRATAVVMLICFGQAACVRNLPPPPAPSQEMPKDVANVPPEVEGKSRVVIDVTNGPARVDEVLATAQSAATDGRHTYVSYGEITRPVCLTTPCAVSLDYGQHNLRLVSTTSYQVGSVGTVDVGQNDSVFRHTMGEQSSGGAVHGLGATAAVLGGVGVILGGSFLLVGALSSSATTSPDGTSSSSGSGVTTFGAVTLGISAGLLALGIGMMIASPPTSQEGSSTQFSLDKTNTDDKKNHLADSSHSL
jgi:hypothetical protein